MSNPEEVTKNKKKPRCCKRAMVGGCTILILAVIGIIAIIQWILSFFIG